MFRELDKYSLAALCRKPSENEWSLGQMYLHLPHSTTLSYKLQSYWANGLSIAISSAYSF
ncbi:hypothetical protein [Paenibacillus alvei]|uniref:hypothetical protein n=1 Tax=Paenibacillus alvei TaxID=44250 RepID=UPI000421019B|nr:hypothetical protein [Paenibacillus alvei]